MKELSIIKEIAKVIKEESSHYSLDENYSFYGGNNYGNPFIFNTQKKILDKDKKPIIKLIKKPITWIKLPKRIREIIIEKIIEKLKENNVFYQLEKNDFFINEYKFSILRKLSDNEIQDLKNNMNMLEVSISNTIKKEEKTTFLKFKFNYIISNKLKKEINGENIVNDFIDWTKKLKNNENQEIKNKKEFVKIINYLAPMIVRNIYYKHEHIQFNENIHKEYRNIIKKLKNNIAKENIFKRIDPKGELEDFEKWKKTFFVIKGKETNKIEVWKKLLFILDKNGYSLV